MRMPIAVTISSRPVAVVVRMNIGAFAIGEARTSSAILGVHVAVAVTVAIAMTVAVAVAIAVTPTRNIGIVVGSHETLLRRIGVVRDHDSRTGIFRPLVHYVDRGWGGQ